MITFFVSIALLIVAYFTYGKYVDRVFGPNTKRQTPAHADQDGIDFIPMSKSKNALIQLLNIAGTGPIFGPIMGALYGPMAFLWIVLGSIFAGGVHDYLTGMISIRNKGAYIPELAGKLLGKFSRHFVNFFSLLLLLLVGTVFVTTPAGMLFQLFGGKIGLTVLISLVFIYYFFSTILPIDQIIGKIYPIMGAVLMTGTLGVGLFMIIGGGNVPELTMASFDLSNIYSVGAIKNFFPAIFFTITCGALSGFHATQSPMISRTLDNESEGRFVFYGMMITEAVIAMIWAAAAMHVKGQIGLAELAANGSLNAGLLVNEISVTLLGAFGGTIAVLGAVILPITSGDTAFRAARSIIADYLDFSQAPLKNRLVIALPLFAISIALTQIDFQILWRYFSWANQVTAAIALWVGAMYLYVKKKNYFISLVPAIFITYMVFVYILIENLGFGLPLSQGFYGAIPLTIVTTLAFYLKAVQNRKANIQVDLEVPNDGTEDDTLVEYTSQAA